MFWHLIDKDFSSVVLEYDDSNLAILLTKPNRSYEAKVSESHLEAALNIGTGKGFRKN